MRQEYIRQTKKEENKGSREGRKRRKGAKEEMIRTANHSYDWYQTQRIKESNGRERGFTQIRKLYQESHQEGKDLFRSKDWQADDSRANQRIGMQEGISVNEESQRETGNRLHQNKKRGYTCTMVHADDDDKSVKLNIESGMNVWCSVSLIVSLMRDPNIKRHTNFIMKEIETEYILTLFSLRRVLNLAELSIQS